MGEVLYSTRVEGGFGRAQQGGSAAVRVRNVGEIWEWSCGGGKRSGVIVREWGKGCEGDYCSRRGR